MCTTSFRCTEYWKERERERKNDCHKVFEWKDYAGRESLIYVLQMGQKG